MKRSITSNDVAMEAGVSRATVSYILNDVPGARISLETRERVLETAKRLGYHFDINAQALKTNRSMSIGVVSRRNITEVRFTSVLGGIKEVVEKDKYSILICSDESDGREYPEYYRLYLGKKIDGIIFLSYQEQLEIENESKRAEMMIKEQVPCVFADYHLGNPIVNCVDIDYYNGGYISCRYLISKGYRKIALLIPDSDTEQERQRLNGVKKAAEEERIDLLIYNIGKTQEDFEKNIIEILKNRSKYSAIIGSWGSISAEILYFTNKMKISVPEEVAVISLAGENASKYTYPKLSTCELPLYELGKKSAKILLNNIYSSMIPVNMALPCELNIRESC